MVEATSKFTIMDDNGEFTPEFIDLVNRYIKEEMEKFTVDGKFNREKAIEYINNYLKEHKDE